MSTRSATLDGGDRGEERCRMTAAAPGVMQAVEEIDLSGLITEVEMPVGDILSEKQGRLLTEALYSSWSGAPPGEDGARRRFAAMANVGLFSSLNEPPLVPDVVLSLDVAVADDLSEKKNRSYAVWQFGKLPLLPTRTSALARQACPSAPRLWLASGAVLRRRSPFGPALRLGRRRQGSAVRRRRPSPRRAASECSSARRATLGDTRRGLVWVRSMEGIHTSC
jgi:hypothetical protein